MTTRSRLLRLLDGFAQRISGSPRPRPGEADPFAGLLPWELTSRAALEVPRSDESIDTEYAAMLLEFAGVCAFRRAIDPALAARCAEVASNVAGDVRALVCQHGLDPDDPMNDFRFDGAYQRGPGRVDLRNHPALSAPPFTDDSLGTGALWLPLIERLLGHDAQLLWKGLVVTEPGTPEQPYHADGPLLSRDAWMLHSGKACQSAALPAHSLTVFVPLVDYDGSGAEPTSFLPGSHRQDTAAALKAEALEAGCSAGAGVPAPLEATAGDAIVFDLRTHHAGGGNASQKRRAVMYLVYAVPWYDGEVQRRLLEGQGVVEMGGGTPSKLKPLTAQMGG